MRDGEEVVVADILTARLQRVAREVGLLIPPHCLGRQGQDGDAEDEEDREPHLAQAGGLAVDPGQLGVQGAPAHAALLSSATARRGQGLNSLWKTHNYWIKVCIISVCMCAWERITVNTCVCACICALVYMRKRLREGNTEERLKTEKLRK